MAEPSSSNGGHPSDSAVPASAILLHLDRILASRAFAPSERHRRFLQFATARHLAGEQPKEYQFGVEVFERPQDFDPRIDTVVRVEAHRLRSRLKKYYEQEGAEDEVIVDFPPGGYTPVFRLRNGNALPPLPAQPARPPIRRGVWIAGATCAAALLAFLALRTPTTEVASPAGRFVLLSGDDPTLRLPSLHHYPVLAASPDGQTIAFLGRDKEGLRLFLRRLDRVHPEPVPGTDGASRPFFSPDGKWLGYFSQGSVKKVALTGGPALVICKTDGHGATWGPDGTVVIGGNPYRGLKICRAEGSKAETLLDIDRTKGEVALGWPRFLPDGEHILFGAWLGGGFDETPIYTYSLKTRRRKQVAHGSFPIYSPTGHLLYARNSTLLASRFNLRTLGAGQEVPVAPQVAWGGLCGVPHFDLLPDGSIVFIPPPDSQGRALLRTSGSGAAQPLLDGGGDYYDPRLSPDGKHLSVSVLSEGRYTLRIVDLRTRASRELNNGLHRSVYGVWSPDGKTIAFASDRDGPYSIYLQPVDGGAPAKRLTTAQYPQYPTSWAPDGSGLLYGELNEKTGGDLGWLPLGGQPVPFLNSTSGEEAAEFSPNGEWVAYVSSQSGRREVFLTRFRNPVVSWQVSNSGGSAPTWSASGDAIIYQNREELLSVPVTAGSVPALGSQRLLTRVPVTEGVFAYRRNYELARDGSGFIILSEEPRTPAPSLHFITNWAKRIGGSSAGRF